MSDSATVRFGIIGMGNMGSAHAKNILAGKTPGLTLVAVCDSNPEKLKGYGDGV
jgi:predicted dehydrogenase